MYKINIPNKRLSEDLLKEDAGIILPTFPHDRARPYQLESLCIAYRALFVDKIENVICQIPTGVGKSGIAIALGEFAKKMWQPYFILTANLGLTKQYKNHFSFLTEVKGRRNFACLATHQICKACGKNCVDPPCTADKAPCIRTYRKYKCPVKMQCPYIIQRNNAIESLSTLTNPQYLFRAANPHHPDFFPQRYLAIYDEGHNIENVLMGYIERKLSQADYHLTFAGSTLPSYTNPSAWVKIAKDMLDAIKPRLDKYERMLEKSSWVLTENDKRTIDRLETLEVKLNDILHILSDAKNVVLSFGKDKRTQHPYVIFKPCRVSFFAPKFLKRISQKRLFLSATIPASTFVDSMGLDPDKTLFINVVKSPFPKANRPVYVDAVGHISKMIRGNDAGVKYKLKDKLVDILNGHTNDKAVIIPNSHRLRIIIYDLLIDSTHSKRTLTHTDYDREATINKFLDDNKPYIIVSTYMREGFDLYDDRCRVLIIPKIPYPDLTDSLIKTRMKNDEALYRKDVGEFGCDYIAPKKDGGLCSNFRCSQPCQEWYKSQTMISLVQACGRAVRHDKDYAKIYILDSAWGRFKYVAEELIPQFFLESVVEK